MKKAIIILLTLNLAACGKSEFEVEVEEMQYYCEMVFAFQQSNGQTGWPDYKEAYSTWCEKGNLKES